MPLREKMKKAFGRSRSGSGSPTLTAVSSTNSSTKKSKKAKQAEEDANWPDNVYKPGKMPRPKYRGVVDKKHRDRLEAFSFGSTLEAMRRRSGMSQYSPMGSRLPSRVGSLASEKRSTSRQYHRAGEELVESGDPDDDVGNVGLSRNQTREDRSVDSEDGGGLDASKTITLGQGSTASGTLMNGNQLEASKTITNGHVNGVRDERVPTSNDISAAVARNTTR